MVTLTVPFLLTVTKSIKILLKLNCFPKYSDHKNGLPLTVRVYKNNIKTCAFKICTLMNVALCSTAVLNSTQHLVFWITKLYK